MNKLLFSSYIIFSILLGQNNQSAVLTTASPMGSSLTTDSTGIVTNFTVGTASPITWYEYATTFLEFNGGNPLEVNGTNADIWDGDPVAPVDVGFFIPARFEDWSFDGASDNEWHTILRYEDVPNNIDVVGGFGYKLEDPSPTLGTGYVEWTPIFQFTNVHSDTVTIKPFRYLRHTAANTLITYYSNHDNSSNFWDSDNIDGTPDDYVVEVKYIDGYMYNYAFSAAQMSHYRIQAYAGDTLYNAISQGSAGYDLTSLTDPVSSSQSEFAFQPEEVTLAQDQSALYWLYPKVILVNNSVDDYPVNIDWDVIEISSSEFNTDQGFTDTDVSINYSSMTYAVNGAGTASTEAKVTVAEITGGMIESGVAGTLESVLDSRYWEIFYDTRRTASMVAMTFSYDTVADSIGNVNRLTVAFRSGYGENWTALDSVVVNDANSTITAYQIDAGAGQWALALNPYNGPVWHVATTGSDIRGDGTEANPFATIQKGIDSASNRDSVLVAAGTYVENINYNGKNIAVIGAGRETTIIDGDSVGTVVTFESGEDSTTVLSGFTITNGNGSGITGYGGRGGGVFCINSSPTLNDLTVDGNQAENSGAGLWFGYSNSQLVDLVISNNSVVGQGSNAGGGISMNYYSDLTLNNMLMVGNEAVYGAGIELWRYSKPLLNNVTIVGNTGSFGGGLLLSGGCNATLINSILWGNSPDEIMIGVSGIPDSASISYSDVFGGLDSIHTNDNGIITWGEGNIDVDPMFVDATNGDYHLADWSPCIGACQDGTDMGAYENALGAPVEYIVISSDTLLVLEDSSAAIDLQDNDLVLNVSTLALSILDSSSHGTIILTGDTMLTYTPMADFFGYDTVQYVLSGTTAADTGFVFITVTAVNDAPVLASIGSQTTNEDTAKVITLSGTDVDGDSLIFIAASADTNVTATINVTTLTLTPTADWMGTANITVTVTDDGTGTLSDSETFIFTVYSIDDLPVVANPLTDITVNEDAPDTTLGDLKNVFLDVDEELIYSHVVNDTGLVFVSVTNDTVTLQFLADANGSSEIVFTATNPTTRASVSDTILVTVFAVNDNPIATNDSVSTNEDTDYSGTFSASDAEGDSLTYSILDSTVNGTLILSDPISGTFIYSPIENFNGSDNLTFSVSDGILLDTGTVNITVVGLNDAPSSFSLNEQDSVYITMASFASDSIVFTWGESIDVDGDELLYDFTGSLKVNGQVKAEYSSSSLTIREMKIDHQSVFDEIFAAQAMLGGIEWDVSVSDGVEEVMSQNGALSLGVNASAAVLSINGELLPEVFALHQNYPNPFNPVTTLRYDLPENGHVNIIIYDMLGKQVRALMDQTQEAGYRSIIWDATNDYGKLVSAGIYLYQIQAGQYINTKKMVLLK